MENNVHEEQESSSSFDAKRLFSKLLKNYRWFLLTIVVMGAAAYLYVRYTIPLYQGAAFIQVQPPEDGTTLLGGSPFSNTGNSKARVMPDMNGEIFKLQSAELIGEVVDSMRLDIEVTTKGNVRNQPVDIDALPFSLSVQRAMRDKASAEYKLTLNAGSYSIQSDKNKKQGTYNQPMVIDGDTLVVGLKEAAALKSSNTWWCRFQSRKQTIANYTGRLLVGQVPKGGAGMLQVVMRDEIPLRAKKIIDVLINKYDYANFLFKNKSLRSEMDFLDNRLTTVNAELDAQESYVRNFKASNKINDVSSSANQLLGSLTSIDTKKGDNEYKESLLKLIETNVNADKEDRVYVPGLQDPDLAVLVARYNDLVGQKKDMLEKAAPMDLRLAPLNAKLSDTKQSMVNRIATIRQELAASNDFLQGQERATTGRFVTLPEKEKDYIQVNRLLNIKQTLYVFLLQRKEDKNIEFASSNILGSRIVDWRVSNVQEPKPLMIYAIALVVALLIPAVIILIRLLLNKRIESPKEIYKATTLPIAGEIAFTGKHAEELVMQADNVTAIAEQFRTLRTNISYLGKGFMNKVLLITSGISGEGKSFISLNLANTLAITNKRVILLEFDLRNPGLSQHIETGGAAGITDYLSGDTDIADIIHPVKDCPNLFFISCGSSLPANPGEIILSHKIPQLFEYLREQFDYVVMDTPPIEAVSDALTLGKWADSSFFIIRHKYSLRSSLLRINQLSQDKKIPHPALIVNGIKPGEGFNTTHGYGYGYGYVDKVNRKKKKRSNLKIA